MTGTIEQIHNPEVIAHRIGRFLELGFDQHDADLLANTRHDWHHVRQMMQNGCSIQLAILILL
jgi:hypothetical protein